MEKGFASPRGFARLLGSGCIPCTGLAAWQFELSRRVSGLKPPCLAQPRDLPCTSAAASPARQGLTKPVSEMLSAQGRD